MYEYIFQKITVYLYTKINTIFWIQNKNNNHKVNVYVDLLEIDIQKEHAVLSVIKNKVPYSTIQVL